MGKMKQWKRKSRQQSEREREESRARATKGKGRRYPLNSDIRERNKGEMSGHNILPLLD